MKKTKIISVRLSQEEYTLLFNDYIWHKESQAWTNWINHTEIKTFSDYIRLMIEIGMNE